MEGTIGEIVMFAGNFAPRNWAFCRGQLLAIQQNTALFSILGTTYGGNGTTTFGLPNLAGRCVVGAGQGPGLSRYDLGHQGGDYNHTLIWTEMPAHSHALQFNNEVKVVSAAGDISTPIPGVALAQAKYEVNNTSIPILRFSDEPGADVTVNRMSSSPYNILSQQAIGASQAHDNTQPSIGMNFIICLAGIFPSRN